MSAMSSRPGRSIRCASSTKPETGGLKPYLLVRGRLEALVARPVMYELVGHGEEIEIDGRAMFAVRSNGAGLPDHAGRRAASG